ncbi:MAG: hypothetical protein E6I88_09510 [Chloroflexi bacterium]|nr:MAG: hypothetical protein E6I88_09510 [Chloroflexota bacterium]
MILFLLLLILAAVGVGVYASENTGTHPVTFLQWHWSAVSDWVPVVIAAAVIGVLFLLYMFYSGLVHGVRIGSMRRRVSTRENAINDMRGENQRLREENARLRAEQRGMDRGAAVGERRPFNPNVDRQPVASSRTADGAPVADGGNAEPARMAPAYRPRPTFGERVRAFFSGREPAGY